VDTPVSNKRYRAEETASVIHTPSMPTADVNLVPLPPLDQPNSHLSREEKSNKLLWVDNMSDQLLQLVTPFSGFLMDKLKSYLQDTEVSTRLEIISVCVKMITTEYVPILLQKPIFTRVIESLLVADEPITSYRPMTTQQITFWQQPPTNFKDMESALIVTTPPIYRFDVDANAQYSTFAFTSLDVKGDGNCYYRCLSLILLGDERHYWYFKSLLRMTLCQMSRDVVISLYKSTINEQSIFGYVVDDLLTTHVLEFEASDITDDNIWVAHTVFCDLMLDDTRYANTIHYQLMYIFLALIRVYGVHLLSISGASYINVKSNRSFLKQMHCWILLTNQL